MASLDEYRKLLAEAKQLAAEYGAQYSALEKRVLELRKQRARDQESPNYNPNDPINLARDAEIAGLSAEKTNLLLQRDEQNDRVSNFTNLIERFEAEEAAKKENNSGTGTPGTAGEGADASRKALTVPPTTTDPSVPAKTTTTDTAIGITQPEPTTDPSKGNPLGAGVLPSRSNLDPTTGAARNPGATSIDAKKEDARSAAADNKAFAFSQQGDWRVRLSLAPGATYLYKASNPGILAPLAQTAGIIFPYTPSISLTYQANYDPSNIQHSNYKIFQYQNSAVESITVGCDFTAQDTYEANYLLAVIHFLRSATKMFYGQDKNPVAGIPPPLCYLHGLGQFQFNGHPLVINNFTYALPTDVDYIKATGGTDALPEVKATAQTVEQRRLGSQVSPNGNKPPAKLGDGSSSGVTYVPTKISLQFTAYPVVARNDISQKFSLAEYATGQLLLGNKKSNGRGYW
jgi:hypothetical protein